MNEFLKEELVNLLLESPLPLAGTCCASSKRNAEPDSSLSCSASAEAGSMLRSESSERHAALCRSVSAEGGGVLAAHLLNKACELAECCAVLAAMQHQGIAAAELVTAESGYTQAGLTCEQANAIRLAQGYLLNDLAHHIRKFSARED